MCQFFSSIVTRQGDILWNEYTNSHEDLVEYFNLRDDNNLQHFVRCEFTPKENKYADVEHYTLKVDEKTKPKWFVEIQEATKEKMSVIISKMIIRGEKNLLLGGCYILDNAKVNKIKNVVVKSMSNSQVNEMWDNSQVNEMWENSQVKKMWGNSQVKKNNSKHKTPKE